MRSILPAFVLAAALGACSGAQHDDTAAKAGQSGAPLGQALPQGFALHFPFDFQEDVVVSVNPRDQRRRVTVEYLEGDSKMIMASLARSALEAGFGAASGAEMPVAPAAGAVGVLRAGCMLLSSSAVVLGRGRSVNAPSASNHYR